MARCLWTHWTWLCATLLALAINTQVVADVHRRSITTGMSVEAEQILLDVKDELKLTHITGKPIAVYRLDLPDDYIAYWEMEAGEEYFTISAGQQTGDNDLVLEGPLPRPTSNLEEEAESRNVTCYKFYMLTPGGEMMCKDKDGTIVATTIPDYIIEEKTGQLTSSEDFIKALNLYIESKLTFLEHKWAKHAVHVRKSFEKDETVQDEEDYNIDIDDESFEENDSKVGGDDSMPTNVDVLPLTPGIPRKVALGEYDEADKIHIRYMPFGDVTEKDKMDIESKLYSVIKGCVATTSGYGEMSEDVIKEDQDTGLKYLELEMEKDAEQICKGQNVVFAVEFHHTQSGLLGSKYYGIYDEEDGDLSHKKRRVGKEYQSWSSYTEKYIPMMNLFPHYYQFTSGGCSVGCGPVAWAMVFGYLDRRAHSAGCSSYGSCGLYRSGADGTSGSDDRVAPDRNDDRTKKYIEELNDSLGTFCLGSSGATLMGKLDNAAGFFKARQSRGSPHLVKKSWWLTYLGRYTSSISSWARSRIDEGWPVIIGWRTNWLAGWHYPVVTGYKRRTRRWRRCYGWFGCGSWKTETQYKMYLHMGWSSTSSDGWRDMEAFYAIAARY